MAAARMSCSIVKARTLPSSHRNSARPSATNVSSTCSAPSGDPATKSRYSNSPAQLNRLRSLPRWLAPAVRGCRLVTGHTQHFAVRKTIVAADHLGGLVMEMEFSGGQPVSAADAGVPMDAAAAFTPTASATQRREFGGFTKGHDGLLSVDDLAIACSSKQPLQLVELRPDGIAAPHPGHVRGCLRVLQAFPSVDDSQRPGSSPAVVYLSVGLSAHTSPVSEVAPLAQTA
jgi:hypothetical protein